MSGIRPGSFSDVAKRMMRANASEREIHAALIERGASAETARKTICHARSYGLGPNPWLNDDRRRAVENRKAGVFHLVDLKRAGHSPRRTELRIPTDLDRPTRYASAVDVASYLGSSAAACADLGS